MNSSLTLAARLTLDAQQWQRGLAGAEGRMTRFAKGVRGELSSLNSFLRSTQGTLASIGAGVAIGRTIADSAKTDQALTRIMQTAGMTRHQAALLRKELHGMAGETGNNFDSLQEGFGQLVAGGLAFEKALPTIDAVNKSMRVTGSEATILTGALLSAQEHFKFDLSQPNMALTLLDKMTVAGREGVIEIEDLASVFGSAASEAKAAGLTFEQTLAMFEGFGTATTKDRVGTLVASTLRLFTNDSYRKRAQKETGIRFYDAQGEKRDVLAVFADIKREYDKLKTDQSRDSFIAKAFKGADLDTIKGIRTAMGDGKLDQMLAIASKMNSAGGTTMADLPANMDNAVAQAGVLKETLAEAGDRFARPITRALTSSIQYLTGSKDKGGLDLSGGQLLGGATAAVGGAYIGSRIFKGALGKMLGGAGSLAGGVAMGAALEKAGAATPVFIVGAAPGVMGGGGSAVLDSATGAVLAKGGRKIGTGALMRWGARNLGVGTLARMGLAGAGTVAGGVGAAALGGWGVGSVINKQFVEGTAFGDALGRSIARAMAALGSKDAQQALANEQRVKLDIDVDVKDNLTIVRTRTADFRDVRGGSTASTGRRTSGGGK